MRTKENYRGEQFDVTFDKLFHTSDGMGFVLKREEDIDSRMMEVFGTDIHIHLANVGLLYKANVFVSYLGEHFFKTNPNFPNNFSGIDKRVPKNGVDFKPDFNIFGALDKGGEKAIIKKLCGDLKVKAETLSDLMEIKKSMLDTEKQRTEKAIEGIETKESYQKKRQ